MSAFSPAVYAAQREAVNSAIESTYYSALSPAFHSTELPTVIAAER